MVTRGEERGGTIVRQTLGILPPHVTIVCPGSTGDRREVELNRGSLKASSILSIEDGARANHALRHARLSPVHCVAGYPGWGAIGG